MPSSRGSPASRRRCCSARRSSYPGEPQRLVERAGRSRRCRRSCPVGSCRGTASGAIRLRRRISSGSRPSSSAARSTIRSSSAAASGPAGAAEGADRCGVGDARATPSKSRRGCRRRPGPSSTSARRPAAAETGVGPAVADAPGIRSPVIRPSALRPSSTYCTWPRPCIESIASAARLHPLHRTAERGAAGATVTGARHRRRPCRRRRRRRRGRPPGRGRARGRRSWREVAGRRAASGWRRTP